MTIPVRIFGGFLTVLLLAATIAAVGWRALDDFDRRAGVALGAQTAAANIDAMLVASHKFVSGGAPADDDSPRRASSVMAGQSPMA